MGDSDDSMADDVERLIHGYTLRKVSASSAWKLGVVMDLEGLRDDRVMAFFLAVLEDHREPTNVRIHVLKRIRNGGLAPHDRARAAEALMRLSMRESTPEVRMHAVVALGEFTDVAEVVGALGRIALDQAAALDLRYGAYTSVEQCGPTPESIALLRRLLDDQTLGRTARSALLAWRVPEVYLGELRIGDVASQPEATTDDD
jgi:hypothetical protein